MESILARALEYTLKYWLKSFSRDQFKLQGRTAQLSNLDINGDALHASVGLPPALNVAKAKVGKLQITLPPVSYVQVEPIVVQIDKLDLVLEEKSDLDICVNSSSGRTSTSSGKGSAYGFADKIADAMTLEVGTVNLLVETRGGSRRQGGAAWAPPLASITIRNLLLYTTNENWQVVNLKEARDFSSDNKCIYVFKKLEWESLSFDLLPHPDMFTDAHLTCSEDERNTRDDDGAKRVFFGGERFLEGISGQAYITVQRTELNSPLGLEVRFHITEAVCPDLSEPGLRALLRCMTGLFVCLNRGDVDPKAQESTEAAGRSLVSVIVDHIFLCIKDAEFQLELLMQSLFFSRASISDRENTKNLSHIMIGGLFLRDTFSHPPCTLVQPSMQAITRDSLHIPEFGKDFCPPIYPLGDKHWKVDEGVPLIVLYSLQINPTPAPPYLASQTVIDCQPLLINLQEESCLRICSFLADGVVVNHGAVLPDYSVNSIVFTLKELDLTIPLDTEESEDPAMNGNAALSSFAGARLHIENLFYSESPMVKLRLLNLDKDPACFCLWEDQPVDSSQKKWITQASNISLSLETCSSIKGRRSFRNWSTGLWKCVELNDACIEAAMATADGSPLINVPPPGGIVRVGVSCQQYLSNTSVEQSFFVLDLYAYFGRVVEKIGKVRDSNQQKKNTKEILGGRLMEKVPSDTAISLAVKDLQLRFLETDFINIQGMPLVKFIGGDLFIKVSHRALGGAIAVSSSVRWNNIRVDCVDAEGNLTHENGMMKTPIEPGLLMAGNGYPQMRAVFWVDEKFKHQPKGLAVPFLDISMVHVMPYDARDMECQSLTVSAKVAGVRLGGGMNYTEALLHRFGILGPDGGPGEGLSKGLKNLSTGPLSKLFRASTLIMDNQKENGSSEDGEYVGLLDLEKPDNVDVSIELIDWLFALEGAQEMAERWWFPTHEDVSREARCWHTSFQSLQVKAKSGPKNVLNGTRKAHRTQKYPVELVTVGVEGLQALKPQAREDIVQVGVPSKGFQETIGNSGGINLEVRMVISEADDNAEMVNWIVENLKFSVRQPIEAVATKEELQHLAFLCKSEVDSMGRIAAGILRVLKLEESIGQAAIDQLSNLGTEGLDRIFTPEKLSTRGSAGSIGSSPNVIGENPRQSLESTVSSLEAEVEDCQEKFSALITESSSSEFSTEHLAHIEQLRQNFEHMQVLLMRLRTQL